MPQGQYVLDGHNFESRTSLMTCAATADRAKREPEASSLRQWQMALGIGIQGTASIFNRLVQLWGAVVHRHASSITAFTLAWASAAPSYRQLMPFR
jgi:hypothetical protein